jgi:hypothetical protein
VRKSHPTLAALLFWWKKSGRNVLSGRVKRGLFLAFGIGAVFMVRASLLVFSLFLATGGGVVFYRVATADASLIGGGWFWSGLVAVGLAHTGWFVFATTIAGFLGIPCFMAMSDAISGKDEEWSGMKSPAKWLLVLPAILGMLFVVQGVMGWVIFGIGFVGWKVCTGVRTLWKWGLSVPSLLTARRDAYLRENPEALSGPEREHLEKSMKPAHPPVPPSRL